MPVKAHTNICVVDTPMCFAVLNKSIMFVSSALRDVNTSDARRRIEGPDEEEEEELLIVFVPSNGYR